jgi:Fe-S oxidoreductase
MHEPSSETIVARDLDPGFARDLADAPELRKLLACLTCGGCSSGCPLSQVGREFSPRTMARMLVLGMKGDAIASDFVYQCTMCARCTQGCPMGIEIDRLVRKLRGIRVRTGAVPRELQATVDAHLKARNNMEVSEEDFVETCEWIAEELREELDDPTVAIPVNKKGARVFYTLNPREVKFAPLSLSAAAKIFHVAGEDWTLWTDYWDVTNYGYFSGDDEAARQITRWRVDAFRDSGCSVLASAECGHGYYQLAKGMELWLGEKRDFPVLAFTELVAEYIQASRLRLDPSANPKPTTYHDPCHLARKSGVVEAPRICLRHAVSDFREMEPHGLHNICCGGGGGTLASVETAKPRIAAGALKAEQIRATAAQVVATTCHNCIDQLGDIKKHYGLKVDIKLVGELAANALVTRG